MHSTHTREESEIVRKIFALANQYLLYHLCLGLFKLNFALNSTEIVLVYIYTFY